MQSTITFETALTVVNLIKIEFHLLQFIEFIVNKVNLIQIF